MYTLSSMLYSNGQLPFEFTVNIIITMVTCYCSHVIHDIYMHVQWQLNVYMHVYDVCSPLFYSTIYG